MGFEQLAQLKEQLAAKAKAEKSSQQAKSGQTSSVKKSSVDPVVITIGRLQKLFPKAFPKNPSPKVPLKIGIHEDLLVRSTTIKLTEAELRDAIKTWCRGMRYWASITEGAPRLDLDGNPAGTVTEIEASQARALEARRNRPRPQNTTVPSLDEPVDRERGTN